MKGNKVKEIYNNNNMSILGQYYDVRMTKLKQCYLKKLLYCKWLSMLQFMYTLQHDISVNVTNIINVYGWNKKPMTMKVQKCEYSLQFYRFSHNNFAVSSVGLRLGTKLTGFK